MNVLQHHTREAFAASLNQLLERHGLPVSLHGRVQAFAGLINRPISTAHRWLSAKGIPDVEDLFLLCGIFSCSLDELLGRSPIKREYSDKESPTTATYFSDNGNADISIPKFFLPFDDPSRPLGILRVSGPEMIGYAEDGDRVFFDLSETEIQSGSVYALRIDQQLAIRRLRIRLDRRIDVLCENTHYPPELTEPSCFKPASEAGPGDIAILGRIVAKLNFS